MAESETRPSDYQSVISDPRIAICLSGGGFRAALYHLGALRRLNELGVLSQITTIASVSGGSILAGHLATKIRSWPAAGTAIEETKWLNEVERPFHEFVRHDIRTWPILKRILFPWNWFRPSTQVYALEACYRKKLTKLMLHELPEHPTYIFCGTDITFGIVWVFERSRVGSYQWGYLTPALGWPLSQAIAASSCFPPIFGPMPIAIPSSHRGRLPVEIGPKVYVSDGGLHDNLGLDPVQKCSTVLVSDGGSRFRRTNPRTVLGRLSAYLSIISMQSDSLRRLDLIKSYIGHARAGAYWGISSAPSRYRGAAEGYSKDLAETVISRIRTDMDAFSDAEIAVLENHGYLLADIAIEVHAPQLKSISAPKKIPYPDFMDEDKVSSALRDSHERRWFGRK